MRYKAVVSLVTLSSTLAASEDWGLNHHWAVLADFVYMRRSEIHGHRIVTRTDDTGLVMSTHKLLHDFDFEPGFRAGLAYTPDWKKTVEANFLYVNEWSGDDTQHGDGNLNYPFHNPAFTQDYVDADKAEGRYRSRFYSAEMNYWRHVTPRRVDYFSGSWLLGLRYINLRELCAVEFFKGMDKSQYRIRARNLMGGPQIGGCMEWNPTEHLTWNFSAKFAPLLDRSEQKTFLGDVNDTVVIRNFTKRDWNAVFLADIAASVHFEPTSHFDFHVGYQMIYLAGVALAAEQFSNSSDVVAHKRVTHSGNALIQGPFAGLIFTF